MSEKITYKSKISSADTWRILRAVLFPVALVVLAMFAIEGLAGFGSKLIAPLTGIMWGFSALCAYLLPSHRSRILNQTYVTIGSYFVSLISLKRIIVLMSGVSPEALMAAFNQSIPVTTGTAVSGFLQSSIWIVAVTVPLGHIGMQAKSLFTFKRRNSAEKTKEALRSYH